MQKIFNEVLKVFDLGIIKDFSFPKHFETDLLGNSEKGLQDMCFFTIRTKL